MNDYRKMLDYIRTYGWQRGPDLENGGSVCLVGAYAASVKGQVPQHEPTVQNVYDEAEEVLRELKVVIAQQECVDESLKLWVFNDMEDTTQEKVERYLEKAAIMRDERVEF